MLPVEVQIPVLGSYSSADVGQQLLSLPTPPNTRTLPVTRRTAVACERGVVMLPVAVHVGGRSPTTNEVGPAVGPAGWVGVELRPGDWLGVPIEGWAGRRR